MPGQVNTVSVTNAPESRVGSCRPAMVIIGSKALRRVWRINTLRSGTPFVWNATNLSRDLRGQVLDLFALYKPRIRIVYVESSYDRQLRQNRERDAAVPIPVLERMLHAWDVPDRTEAHQVDYVITE